MGIGGRRQPLVERRARKRPQLALRRASSTSTGTRWNAHLRNKVLLPVLGDQYGRVLERQELTLDAGGRRVPTPLLRARSCRSSRARRGRSWTPVSMRSSASSATTIPRGRSTRASGRRWPTCRARPRRHPERVRRADAGEGGDPASARPARGDIRDRCVRRSTTTLRALNGTRGETAELRRPRSAARRAALSAGALARGRRGDQLPALLRHQRAGGHPHGRSRGLPGDAPAHLPARGRGQGHRPAHRPSGRPLRPARLLPRASARARCPGRARASAADGDPGRAGAGAAVEQAADRFATDCAPDPRRPDCRPLYVVAEKILGRGRAAPERLGHPRHDRLRVPERRSAGCSSSRQGRAPAHRDLHRLHRPPDLVRGADLPSPSS